MCMQLNSILCQIIVQMMDENNFIAEICLYHH